MFNACRLTFVFLAFDVFFAIFCVVLACLIGIALCCCLPCIIALLYALAGQVWAKRVQTDLPLKEMKLINSLLYLCVQEGASEADLSILPKYRFQIMNNGEKQSEGSGKMIPVEAGNEYSGNERELLAEDAVSCYLVDVFIEI